MTEHFDADHIHTTPSGRHFRHGDGIEVDGEGNSKILTEPRMDIECKEYEGKGGAFAVARKQADKYGRMAAIYDFGKGVLHVRWLPVENEERQYLRYMV